MPRPIMIQHRDTALVVTKDTNGNTIPYTIGYVHSDAVAYLSEAELKAVIKLLKKARKS